MYERYLANLFYQANCQKGCFFIDHQYSSDDIECFYILCDQIKDFLKALSDNEKLSDLFDKIQDIINKLWPNDIPIFVMTYVDDMANIQCNSYISPTELRSLYIENN